MQFVSIYDPAHNKTYNKTCAASEDSDLPVHPHSQTRVCADGKYILQFPMRDDQEPLEYGAMYRLGGSVGFAPDW